MATERQISFVKALVRSGDQTQAAIDAGYAQESAAVAASKLLALPSVSAMIAVELERVRIEGGLLGFNTLRLISRSDKAPAAARVTAARTLMEYAGMIGRTGQAEKDPADMSTEELRHLLGRIDTEIVSRAKPVNGPVASPIPSQVIDLID